MDKNKAINAETIDLLLIKYILSCDWTANEKNNKIAEGSKLKYYKKKGMINIIDYFAWVVIW